MEFGWEHMSSFCIGGGVTAALVRVLVTKIADKIDKIPDTLVSIQKELVRIDLKLETLDKLHAQVLDHDRKLAVLEARHPHGLVEFKSRDAKIPSS